MKTRRIHGFMCPSSHVSAGACIPVDSRSVVVPRKPERTLVHHHHHNRHQLHDATTKNMINDNVADHLKYSRLLQGTDSPAMTPAAAVSGIVKKPLGNGPSLPPAFNENVFQVVVMRVSLHCQGCAGKVKKHLSKMEGVTSFSIDLESKRVIVRGHVSPVGVLESISKVKKAEFWTS